MGCEAMKRVCKTLYKSLDEFLAPLDEKSRRELFYVDRFLTKRYGARLLLVGGVVRDLLLGKRVSDIDIECYCITQEEFESAMRELGAQGVGRSFFVYKYGNIDIALPRIERKNGYGHRAFEVSRTDDEIEAARRRDFTINALGYELKEERVIDYWGGLEDLERGILRAVYPQSFVEDSLRVLRAMQFSSRLAFKIERETCLLCREIDIDDLPCSRIFGEFRKMFLSDYPHYGLYALESLDISVKLWGEGLGHRAFFAAAGDMLRYKKYFRQDMREFYFLAIYSRYSGRDIDDILEAIDAPRIYRRVLRNIPEIPEEIKDSFVASLALKEGVCKSPLNYIPQIADRARSLGVWSEAFRIETTAHELMERGFRGKALAEELSRLKREAMMRLDEEGDIRET